ncbi:MAG: tetratricopeptide repeat protein [Polyangia bacterium]
MGDFRPQKVLSRAMALHQAGKYAEADALYRKILDAVPEHGDALHMAGVLAYQTGKPQRALALITRARRHFPQMPELHNHLGLVLQALGRGDEAEVEYKTALALRPGFAEAHHSYGALLLARGQAEAAYRHVSLAVRLRPDDANLHNTLGNVLQALGRPADAVGCYERALQLSPQLAMAMVNLGNALRALKQLEAAAVWYERAMAADPREGNACLYLGATLDRLGRREASAAAFEEALRRRPGWSEAQFFLGALRNSAVKSEPPAAAPAPVPVPAAAPPGYVAQLFDGYAAGFDQHLTERLQYRGPELLYQALAPHLPERPLDVLDLGCGTGLLAPLVRRHAARLGGVDLSAGMLAQAQRRGLYDELVRGDLVELLRARPAAYDVLVAADVLIYLGDLEPLFRAAMGALRPPGLFAFTVEAPRRGGQDVQDGQGGGEASGPGEVPDVVLQPTRRYAHSAAYVRRLAAAHGFVVLIQTDAVLRRQSGEDIAGHIVVLQTSAAEPAPPPSPRTP